MKFAILFATACLFWQPVWEEFASLDGRFRVTAPGEFKESADSVHTDIGTLVFHTFFIQTEEEEAENLFYMITYCDYPEGLIFADSVEFARDFFNATIEEATLSVKGTLMYETDVKMGEHPGKFWRIDYLDGSATIKTKAYLAGDRFYSIQTISYKEKNLNRDSDRFFDSFRIL